VLIGTIYMSSEEYKDPASV